MESPEARVHKESLALALRRYSAAVSDMEQTVLLPSLLRDVPSHESSRDLYDNYLMLKAIRNTVEGGLGSLQDGHKAAEGPAPEPPTVDMDAQGLIHFHLRGLFSVMKDLTSRTKSLTGKYKDIIGVSN